MASCFIDKKNREASSSFVLSHGCWSLSHCAATHAQTKLQPTTLNCVHRYHSLLSSQLHNERRATMVRAESQSASTCYEYAISVEWRLFLQSNLDYTDHVYVFQLANGNLCGIVVDTFGKYWNVCELPPTRGSSCATTRARSALDSVCRVSLSSLQQYTERQSAKVAAYSVRRISHDVGVRLVDYLLPTTCKCASSHPNVASTPCTCRQIQRDHYRISAGRDRSSSLYREWRVAAQDVVSSVPVHILIGDQMEITMEPAHGLCRLGTTSELGKIQTTLYMSREPYQRSSSSSTTTTTTTTTIVEGDGVRACTLLPAGATIRSCTVYPKYFKRIMKLLGRRGITPAHNHRHTPRHSELSDSCLHISLDAPDVVRLDLAPGFYAMLVECTHHSMMCDQPSPSDSRMYTETPATFIRRDSKHGIGIKRERSVCA